MRFDTREASIEAAAIATAELRPEMPWLGKQIPLELVGGKDFGTKIGRWGFFSNLRCMACSVPPGQPISLFTSMTQLGLEASGLIKETYTIVRTRVRSHDGATTEPVAEKGRRTRPTPNGRVHRPKK